MYKKVVEIRLVEERIGELVSKDKIKNSSHSLYIGEEAVATGVFKFKKGFTYLPSTRFCS